MNNQVNDLPDGIARRLGKFPTPATPAAQWALQRFAQAMLALSCDAFAAATNRLRRILPDLARIGGSQVQNQLFDRLGRRNRP